MADSEAKILTEEYIVTTFNCDIRSLHEIKTVLSGAPALVHKILSYAPQYLSINEGNSYNANQTILAELLGTYDTVAKNVYVSMSTEISDVFHILFKKATENLREETKKLQARLELEEQTRTKQQYLIKCLTEHNTMVENFIANQNTQRNSCTVM